MNPNIFAWVVLISSIVAFAIGATLGYAIGRADGEDAVARYYEDKIRRKGMSL